jgi:hypothetical protein
MTSEPSPLVRAIARAVETRLAADLPRVSAHYGADYADSDDPPAVHLREHGDDFRWVAFGFDPHPMWDAHVGVLAAETVLVGFHVHDRAVEERPAALDPVAEAFDATYRYSEAAAEHQWNRPAVARDAVDPEAFGATVADMCRRFAPVVDDLLE